MKYRRPTCCLAFLILATLSVVAAASDWPTYQHDNQRSGVTDDRLDLPLEEAWRWTSGRAPQPAWPDPAPADFWHYKENLVPRVTFDRAFHVAAVGNTVYFGSSVNDKVYALDAATGEERWSFFTGGPVRLAPSLSAGRVYVGSDDGWVYCVDGTDGDLIWKHKPAPHDRKVLGNGRMISLYPIRTGVLVADDVAYFCAGLFPAQGIYIGAMDAETGSELWNEELGSKLDRLSAQGYLLASATRLYVPAGRSSPIALDRRDGAYVRTLNSTGGAYALLTGDMVLSGPADRTLTLSGESGDTFASFRGRRMIVTERVSYLLTDTELCALDRVKYAALAKEREVLSAEREKAVAQLSDMRKKRASLSGRDLTALDKQIDETRERISEIGKRLRELEGNEYLWRQSCDTADALILAGNVLFAGGDGLVAAFNAGTGKMLWTGTVQGKAHGLAVANDRLFVSTDSGTIHCFVHGTRDTAPSAVVADKQTPYPADRWSDVYASAAEHIIRETGITRGYCLVVGCGDGRLAYELAQGTELNIVGIEEDERKVAAAREALDRAGFYGKRATVHQGLLAELPYSDYFANLIVSQNTLTSGVLQCPAKEIVRVLRPCGGVAYLGQTAAAAGLGKKLDRDELDRWLTGSLAKVWKVLDDNGLWATMQRGSLVGSGEWTHQYADPGNSACSGDELLRSPMEVLWFGQPGPRYIIDRHHRGMVPLSKAGRLFVPGDNRITAVDAYNGCQLWDVVVPNSRRICAQRDAGMMAVTDDYLYVVAEDRCHLLDVGTGRCMLSFQAPQLIRDEQRHWGYVAAVDDLLIGSGQKDTASYTEISRRGDIAVQFSDFGRIVTSDYLFCLDRHTGKVRWTYNGGVVVNPTIALGDGKVYFVESHIPRAVKDDEGRMRLQILLGDGAELVALDAHTGKVLWERPIDIGETCNHILFLNYAKNVLVLTGTSNKNDKVHYHLYAFDGKTGTQMWYREHFHPYWPTGGDHGEQTRHPAIVGDVVYAEPYAYHLRTGEPVTRVHPVTGEEVLWDIYRGHGCGTFSASASCLFYRSSDQCMNDLRAGAGPHRWTGIRPGCWINMIPAGGILLVPEGSSGCTCPFPVQTSIAYVPTESKENWSAFQSRGGSEPVKHLAVNLGPPGDQRAKDGTLWLSYPRPPDRYTVKLPVEIELAEGSEYFHYNSDVTAIHNTDIPWVFTSGCSGNVTCRVALGDTGEKQAGYTVRLYFTELSEIPAGERVFDIKLQGDVFLDNFDIVKAASGSKTAIVKEFSDIKVNDTLVVELVAQGGVTQDRAPVLNGIEVVRQGT